MIKNIKIIALAVSAGLLFACSSYSNKSPVPSVSEEAQRELHQPVNCATARQDITILTEEKASVGKRMISGVRSIMPIAVVAGLLMGDYSDRVSVAAGTYNDDIDKKIKQIQSRCGIR